MAKFANVSGINAKGGLLGGNALIRTGAAALIGGAVSKLAGGSFETGAISGAFSQAVGDGINAINANRSTNAQRAQQKGQSEFDRFNRFVRSQGVERTSSTDPFIHERVANSWDDIPPSVRNYEPDTIWNYLTNADNIGFHGQNQRLPGGYHLTIDNKHHGVYVHHDFHDPTRGAWSSLLHGVEMLNINISKTVRHNINSNWR